MTELTQLEKEALSYLPFLRRRRFVAHRKSQSIARTNGLLITFVLRPLPTYLGKLPHPCSSRSSRLSPQNEIACYETCLCFYLTNVLVFTSSDSLIPSSSLSELSPRLTLPTLKRFVARRSLDTCQKRMWTVRDREGRSVAHPACLHRPLRLNHPTWLQAPANLPNCPRYVTFPFFLRRLRGRQR